MIDYTTLKQWLFKLQPENAHHLAEFFLRIPNVCPILFGGFEAEHFIADPALKQNIFGVDFLNPVGLAAGFDKNATMLRGVQALGFGFSEIGTVTLRAQSGNPKPRMFRHIEDRTIQNAMGFNNDGLLKVQKRLQKRHPFTTPIGVNIGKNKTTSESDAVTEYLTLIKALHTLSDYMVINLSSPNTPGLRDLQNETFVSTLFKEAKELTEKPILLKIAPDMSESEAVDISALAVEKGASGIIATNTTVDYSLVAHPKDKGGLSGAVLKEKSFTIFAAVAKELFGKATLVSVGGIDSAEEAYKRIRYGASLVEVYTGLIFNGPSLIRDINLDLIDLLNADGFDTISQAVGADLQ
jgi:dihydroorotate dehydrogenase